MIVIFFIFAIVSRYFSLEKQPYNTIGSEMEWVLVEEIKKR